MKNMKKLGLALCGLMAAAVITVGVSSPAQAAPKNYVTKISSVTVNGTKVKQNATYKMYLGSSAKTTPTVKVKVKVAVKGKASQSVTYSSSKKSVASISSKGTITAKKAGTTTIKITTKGKNKSGKKLTYSFKVNVSKTKLTTALSGSKNGKLTLTRTGTSQKPYKYLSVTANTGLSTLKVTSRNTKVVSVSKVNSKKWKVTGVGEGTAKVSVQGTSKGNKATRTNTYTITVKNQKATGISITGNVSSLKAGEADTIAVAVAGNPAVAGYTVTSSNTNVASVAYVSGGAKITAKAPGKVTITVKSKDGAAVKSYTLTVNALTENFTVKSAEKLDDFTLSNVKVSDLKNFLENDMLKIAKELGALEGSDLSITADGIKYTVSLKDGKMCYAKKGEEVAIETIVEKIGTKTIDSITLPTEKRLDEIILSLADTNCVTSAYTVSCTVNGTTISATNVKLAAGTVYFTTEGITFTATVKSAEINGKDVVVVTVASSNTQKFSSTAMYKAMKDIGIL